MKLRGMTGACLVFVQVLANIEAAQRQNRLYDALKQGTVALQALQKVQCASDNTSLHWSGFATFWPSWSAWQ